LKKRRAGENVGAQLRVGGRQHPQPAQHQRGGKHDDQGRKNSPDPPVVKAPQAEALLIQFARDDAGDQKAGNDEENIDADEAARHRLRKGMKVHHQHHGDGPEAVDIRPISIRRLGQIRPIHDRAQGASKSADRKDLATPQGAPRAEDAELLRSHSSSSPALCHSVESGSPWPAAAGSKKMRISRAKNPCRIAVLPTLRIGFHTA
jgi:hypothetical protein